MQDEKRKGLEAALAKAKAEGDRLTEGNALHELALYDEALAAYGRAIEQKPQWPAPWIGKGNALKGLGRFEEALSAYEHAIELNPNFLSALKGKGDTLFSLGRFAEALTMYEKAFELNSEWAPLWLCKGNALMELGRLAEALVAHEQATKLSPQWAPAWNGMGNALQDLGRHKEALLAYERAITLDPSFALPWNGKGMALQDVGNPDGALEAYERAIRLAPDYAAPWHNKGNVLQDLGRIEEALEAYEQATVLNRNLAAPWSDKGNILLGLGRLSEALEAFGRAIALDQMMAAPWNGLGNAYFELGRNEEARAAYEHAITLEPDLAHPWNGQGNALQGLGRFREALTAYEHAISLDQTFALPWSNKGNALLNLGLYEEALKAYETAIELDPNSVMPWHNKGNALQLLGRTGEARTAYEQAVALYKTLGDRISQADALIALATVERAENNDTKARKILEEAEFLYKVAGSIDGQARAQDALKKLDRKPDLNENEKDVPAGLPSTANLQASSTSSSSAFCIACRKYKWPDPQPVLTGLHLCRFHAPKGQKGMKLHEFNTAIQEWIQESIAKRKSNNELETCILSGVVFPGAIAFAPTLPAGQYSLPSIDFTEAKFTAGADFRKMTFLGDAIFDRCEFNILLFQDITAEKEISFEGATFTEQARFVGIHASEGAILMHSLSASSLQWLNFSILDAAKFSFKLCEWPEKLFPESQANKPDKCKDCQALYRHLKRKATEEHNQELVGTWHYREKAMALRTGTWTERLVLFLYWLLSGFGERPGWALGWLTAVALVFPWVTFGLPKLIETGLSPSFDSEILAAISKNWLLCMPFIKLDPGADTSLTWINWIFQIVITLQAALFGFALNNRFRR